MLNYGSCEGGKIDLKHEIFQVLEVLWGSVELSVFTSFSYHWCCMVISVLFDGRQSRVSLSHTVNVSWFITCRISLKSISTFHPKFWYNSLDPQLVILSWKFHCLSWHMVWLLNWNWLSISSFMTMYQFLAFWILYEAFDILLMFILWFKYITSL